MAKSIILCAVCSTVAFCAGLAVQPKDYQFLKEANAYKAEALELNDSLMKYADLVMDQNLLWDADGSDNMANYLEYHYKIDSLYAQEQ